MFFSSILLIATLAAAHPMNNFNFDSFNDTIKMNDRYDVLRPLLSDAGWKPAAGKRDCTDGYCSIYPEAEECSSAGMLACNLVWRNITTHQILNITIEGEQTPVVTHIEITK